MSTEKDEAATIATGIVDNAPKPDATVAPAKRKRGRPSKAETEERKASEEKKGRIARGFTAFGNNRFFNLCELFGGKDALPSAQERKDFDKSLCEYLMTLDLPNVSPGWFLAMTYMEYIAERALKETVREVFVRRCKTAWEKFKFGISYTIRGKLIEKQKDELSRVKEKLKETI